MAKLIANGVMNIPTQGSTEISEYVKHFESDVSFEDLQDQINVYMLLLKSPTFTNRASIRGITFQIVEKQQNPNKGTFLYYAQLHFVLVGDGDDSAEL